MGECIEVMGNWTIVGEGKDAKAVGKHRLGTRKNCGQRLVDTQMVVGNI